MKKFVLATLVLLGFVLVLQAQTKHTIGEKFGGGVVFSISRNGLHGLICETINQSDDCKLKDAPTIIADPKNHSEKGKAFTDWRLPNKDELKKMLEKKDIIGGFVNGLYWGIDLYMCFGSITIGGDGVVAYHVRSIRSF
jgi:hypothetical protein